MRRFGRYILAAVLLLTAFTGLPVLFPSKSSPDNLREKAPASKEIT